MEKPNFKNINYQWKSKEELDKEFESKGWIKTKDRWVSPQELRESGIVIKNGRVLIPTEIQNDGKRDVRVVAQRYLNYIHCGEKCHNEEWRKTSSGNGPEKEKLNLPDFSL